MKPVTFRTVEISDARFEVEGLRVVTVKSAALGGRGDLTVFVPHGLSASARGVPFVILLHGVYGSHWVWTHKAGVHRTAQRLIETGAIPPMVLAMPSDGLWGDGSGYLPRREKNCECWIVDEVPAAAALAAPGVTTDSSYFIAGFSMGGFGALRLGAKYADRFRAIAGHSAITELSQMQRFVAEPLKAYSTTEVDCTVLGAIMAQRSRLPAIRFDCGRDDPLLEANRKLHRDLIDQGIVHTYEEFPGDHGWPYWENHIEDTLRFFARKA